MTKAEKEKRSQIKYTIKQLEKNDLLKMLPVPIEMLQNLFGFLDIKLSEDNCDDTLKYTLDFIEENKLPTDDLIKWLETNGGYCDCEVLANVEEQINDE